jgi:prepilin-type N-terminal cleavage/methylation domain-containing protein
MKGFFMKQRLEAGSAARRARAFTLVETMVAMSVFSLVSIGLVYTHLFALRQDELANSKLGASDSSRRGFSMLADDVRAAKMWQVGNGNQTTFTPIPDGTAQQGTALKINLTTDTNSYILYYFNTTQGELRRRKSGVTGSKLIAQSLTNSMYFREENFRGDLQTDLSHKDVINVVMDFYQYQYPLTRVGPGYFYDRYTMQFRLTSHVPDGP